MPQLVSIVIPVFDEADNLPELLKRLDLMVRAHVHVNWEIVFADDGSRDNGLTIIDLAKPGYPCPIRTVELSRNFGFQAALSAGMSEAAGDAVVTMDADLQDPPEVIPELLSAWMRGAEVVIAARRSREETGWRRVAFDLFHRLHRMALGSTTEGSGTFGLMARNALDAFNSLPENHRFLPGLREWVGFRRKTIHYDRRERSAGYPKQTFRRLVCYAMDGILGYSYLPLRALAYVGLGLSAVGFALGCFYITRRLFGLEVAPTGFTTLVTLVLFLGGIQLIGIGILGEYLARVYDEVKRRPLYIKRPERSKD